MKQAHARNGRTVGKATWVCFDCRATVRRPIEHAEAVPCPRCGRACRALGKRVRVPAKANDRAWRALREWFRAGHLAEVARVARWKVAERHRLERRAAELEALPPTRELRRQIDRLRERVSALRPESS